MNTVNEPEICVICQGPIEGSAQIKPSRTSMAFLRGIGKQKTIVKLQPCGHEFHHPCISTWVQNKLRCPLDDGLITGSTPAISSTVNLRKELFRLIESNHIEHVREILSIGLKPDQHSLLATRDPLTVAANLKHWAIAVELISAGWTTKDKLAQHKLGRMFEQGLGVDKNYAEAVTLYSKAAAQGYAPAEHDLGLMFLGGRGVQQNYAKALTWIHKAASKGFVYAQYDLGCMFHDSLGVQQNYAKALTWFSKAADQGHAKAQYNLGCMFYYGRGVQQNYTEALTLFQKAADKEDAQGQYNLGFMYWKGMGVEQNDAEARFWISKAADQGYDLALKALTKFD